MMSLRLVCLIGLIAGIHCDFFHSKGSGYGSIAPAYGAPAYGAPPAPASSYGYAPAAPASGYGYGAPAAYAPAVYYEEEKPDLKAKMNEFKSKVIGTLGYIKGSILSAKGQLMLKKAQKLQEAGEKLLGVGETLKALKPVKTNDVHYSAPAPAYGAPAPSY